MNARALYLIGSLFVSAPVSADELPAHYNINQSNNNNSLSLTTNNNNADIIANTRSYLVRHHLLSQQQASQLEFWQLAAINIVGRLAVSYCRLTIPNFSFSSNNHRQLFRYLLRSYIQEFHINNNEVN